MLQRNSQPPSGTELKNVSITGRAHHSTHDRGTSLIREFPDLAKGITDLCSALGLKPEEKKTAYTLQEKVFRHLLDAAREYGTAPILRLMQGVLAGTPSPSKFFRFCEQTVPQLHALAGDDGGMLFERTASIMPLLYSEHPFQAARSQSRHFLRNDLLAIASALRDRDIDSISQEIDSIEQRYRGKNPHVIAELVARCRTTSSDDPRIELFRSDSWWCSCQRAGLGRAETRAFTSEVASNLAPLRAAGDLPTIERIAEECLNAGIYGKLFTETLRNNAYSFAVTVARIGTDSFVRLLRSGVPTPATTAAGDYKGQTRQAHAFSRYVKEVMLPMSELSTRVPREEIVSVIEKLRRIADNASSYHATNLSYPLFFETSRLYLALIRKMPPHSHPSASKVIGQAVSAFSHALTEIEPILHPTRVYAALENSGVIENGDEFTELVSGRGEGAIMYTLVHACEASWLSDRTARAEFLADITNVYKRLGQSGDAALCYVIAPLLGRDMLHDQQAVNATTDRLARAAAESHASAAVLRHALAPLIKQGLFLSAEEVLVACDALLSWKVPGEDFWRVFESNSEWASQKGRCPPLVELAIGDIIKARSPRRYFFDSGFDRHYIVNNPASLSIIMEALHASIAPAVLCDLGRLSGDEFTRGVHYALLLRKLGFGPRRCNFVWTSKDYLKALEEDVRTAAGKILGPKSITSRMPMRIEKLDLQLFGYLASHSDREANDAPPGCIDALGASGEGWRAYRYGRPEVLEQLEFLTEPQLLAWTENTSRVILPSIVAYDRFNAAAHTFLDAFRSEAGPLGKVSIPVLQDVREKIQQLEEIKPGQRSKKDSRTLTELQTKATLMKEILLLEYLLNSAPQSSAALRPLHRLMAHVESSPEFCLSKRCASPLRQLEAAEIGGAKKLLYLRWTDRPGAFLPSHASAIQAPLMRVLELCEAAPLHVVPFPKSDPSATLAPLTATLQKTLDDSDFAIQEIRALPPNRWIISGVRSLASRRVPYCWEIKYEHDLQMLIVGELNAGDTRTIPLYLATRNVEGAPECVEIWGPSGYAVAQTPVFCLPTNSLATLVTATSPIPESCRDEAIAMVTQKAEEIGGAVRVVESAQIE